MSITASAKQYWALARAPRYSLLLALPLYALYQALIGPSASGIRNGADVLLVQLSVALAGPRGPFYLTGALLGVGLVLIVWDLKRSGWSLRPGVLLTMLLEATALSVLTGIVVGTATAGLLSYLAAGGGQLLQAGVRERLALSLGAGLYEELVFRVMLVPLLAFLARALLGARAGLAATIAVVGSALIFSAVHYIGPYGDPLTLPSFTFRFLAGLFFSALYVLRGFGITAWTHALYDVWILVF